MIYLLLALVLAFVGYSPPEVQASCIVDSGVGPFNEGTQIRDDKCANTGAKRVYIEGGSVGAGITGVANAVAPTWAEGAAAQLSIDPATGAVRTQESKLRPCEDQANNLCMTSGGLSRMAPIATAMLVAGDGLFKASQPGYNGNKSFALTITGAAAISQRIKVYGSFESVVDATNGVELCDWTVTGSVKATGACPGVVTANYPFISAVTSSSTGTPSGTLNMGF